MSDVKHSKYHRFQQSDGRGFGILCLEVIGCNRATVVAANLSEGDADDHLAAYRRKESATNPTT